MADVKPHRYVSSDASTGIFISLYLILVAFFIVLNAISNQETAKAVAVMESVNSAFKKEFASKADVLDFVARPDATSPNDEFLDDVRDLLASVLTVEGRFPTLGGNTLRLTLDDNVFFVGRSPQVRPDRRGFLEQMAQLIARAEIGERREVAFILTADTDQIIQGAVGNQRLTMLRAGELARVMMAYDLPEGALTTGIRPGQTSDILIIFRSVPEGRARISFGDGAGR